MNFAMLMFTNPRRLLHVEEASILFLALYFFSSSNFSWLLFALLSLAPDLFLLGYLKNATWGSTFYDLAHTLTLPLLLFSSTFSFPAHQCFLYALIWIAHIAFDRLLGYGLKYPTFFKDSHLQHV